MIMPIPMPLPLPQHTPVCPKCHKTENIKEVCGWCGYEYKDEPYPRWKIVRNIALVLFGLWLVVTVFLWITQTIVPDYGKEAPSLWEVIKSEGRFIRHLRFW